MFKYFRAEFKKMNDSKVPVWGLLLIVFICTGVSIFEFRYIQFGITESFYIDFLLYNATFVVMKVMLPILMLLLAASMWGGEYANGMMKSFLLCKVGKIEMFAGKFLLLILTSTASVFIAFISFTVICALKTDMSGISLYTISAMAKVYAMIIVGMLPILLLTILASIIFGDFQKGFSLGIVLLFLSISLDSVLENAYMSPTYFLSHSYVICTSQVNAAYFIVPVLYTLILIVGGMAVFNRKDIWQ